MNPDHTFYRTAGVLPFHGLGTAWLVMLASLIAVLAVAGLALRARSHR